MDHHQATLHPYLFLFNSHFRFNPNPTFLGVTFDRNLSFSKHVFSLKASSFLCSLLSLGAPLRSPFLFCIKLFFGLLSLILSPRWFPSLTVANITKLERLRRAARRAITGCLSSSPIPLLLSEASLPLLRVTLTDFILSTYKRALHLPIAFSILGLARLGVKPRFCTSSWRAFASTHPLLLSPTIPKKVLFSCSPSPSWNLHSFTVESTLSSPCSRSDPLLSQQGAALAYFDSLPPHDLDRWLCYFFSRQRRLWRTCQLLSLRH